MKLRVCDFCDSARDVKYYSFGEEPNVYWWLACDLCNLIDSKGDAYSTPITSHKFAKAIQLLRYELEMVSRKLDTRLENKK